MSCEFNVVTVESCTRAMTSRPVCEYNAMQQAGSLIVPDRRTGTIHERHGWKLQLITANENAMTDPKTNPTGNTQKDPDDWVSGDEPMTGAQASYLKTLCEQAHTDSFDENLS